jgi:hypothetical protein
MCEVDYTHLHLEPSLRKNVAMPLLPRMPFTACTGIGKYESDLVPEEAQKCVGLDKYFYILSNLFMVLNLYIIIFIIRIYEIGH